MLSLLDDYYITTDSVDADRQLQPNGGEHIVGLYTLSVYNFFIDECTDTLLKGGGGKAGFDTFSHCKGIVNKSTKIDFDLRYRPYDQKKAKMIRSL